MARGPNKELEHFTDDEEPFNYFERILDNVDLLIYGCKSYDTLEMAEWNTILVKGNVSTKVKSQA